MIHTDLDAVLAEFDWDEQAELDELTQTIDLTLAAVGATTIDQIEEMIDIFKDVIVSYRNDGYELATDVRSDGQIRLIKKDM